MSAEGFEYFEVAADIGVRAWGPDLSACFRQCALGVFNLMVPLDAVEPVETREVAAQGETREALLVNWINECLYLHDIEGFVVRELDQLRVGGTRVHGLLRGEPVDPARHPRGIIVKAATYHELQVIQSAEAVAVRMILDI